MSLYAYAYHAEQYPKDIIGLVVLQCPEVWVVGDLRGFVGSDGVTLHHPFYRTFAVYDVAVGGGRDVFDGYPRIVDDNILLRLGQETHFLYLEMLRGDVVYLGRVAEIFYYYALAHSIIITQYFMQ